MSKRLKKRDRELLAWVDERGSVTVADLCGRDGLCLNLAARILIALEKDERLVRSGGGPGEALRWALPTSLLTQNGTAS